MLNRLLGRRALSLTSILIAGASLCGATPYWIAYEGNDYPENEGWWRIWYDYYAQRDLENGSLVMDTLSNLSCAEFYEWPNPGSVDPDAGETFIMQWRVRVDTVLLAPDPGVLVGSDDGSAAGFHLGMDYLEASFSSGTVQVPFEPGVFHEFMFRSTDMKEYDLYLDGTHVLHYAFTTNTSHVSRFAWGHGAQGASSRAHWDYVRFGVVPEPSQLLTLLLLAAVAPVRRRTMRPRTARAPNSETTCTIC